MIQLRPYQTDVSQQAHLAWNAGATNNLIVLPTGAGKTVVATSILDTFVGFRLAVAHRQELVSQISLAFASMGIYHRVFAPDNVVKDIIRLHRKKFGASFVHMQAPTAVAGIDTLAARVRGGDNTIIDFLYQVVVWFMDEGHHILRENKWGQVLIWCPHAVGLAVSATPLRADGKGLGAHTDGVIHHMVVGPSMFDLTGMGFLCPYAPPICPPSDMKIQEIKVGGNGDFTFQGMKKAAQESHIVGDVVKHYQRFANGKLGITFATDVQTASDIAAAYRNAGVPAECVSAKTPDMMRHEIVNRFRNRELLQLVNVDLFGEGFDLPALEVVSMARPTKSYGLYVQQFGRALRPMEGKTEAIIIDHVNNVRTHLLPDHGRPWTLDRKQKRATKNHEPCVKRAVCDKCFRDYEALTNKCPYCGHIKEIQNRSSADFVDGDLEELDAATLEELRNAVLKVMKSPETISKGLLSGGSTAVVAASAAKNQRIRQEAVEQLQHSIAAWAGVCKAAGDDDRAINKRFYFYFGVDILSAQALGRPDAEELKQRIDGTLVC